MGEPNLYRNDKPSSHSKLSILGITLLLIVLIMAVIGLTLYFFYPLFSTKFAGAGKPTIPESTYSNPAADHTANPSTGFSPALAAEAPRSESIQQLSTPTVSNSPAKVVYELSVKKPVVFITIDDGWYPNEDVIKLMKQYHLPITTFLIQQAAQAHLSFWQEFAKAGGHIQDHTIDHPYLTHLSSADQKTQISQPIKYFQTLNWNVDELRPPYGDYNSQVGQSAWDSGIKSIVMWDAEIEDSKLTTRSGKPLKPGDIVLLHWVPDLNQEMLMLINVLQKDNFEAADLSQALNGEPLTNISTIKPAAPEVPPEKVQPPKSSPGTPANPPPAAVNSPSSPNPAPVNSPSSGA